MKTMTKFALCAIAASFVSVGAFAADGKAHEKVIVPVLPASFPAASPFGTLGAWANVQPQPAFAPAAAMAAPLAIIINPPAAPAPATAPVSYVQQLGQASWIPVSFPVTSGAATSPSYSNTPIIYGKPDVPFAGGGLQTVAGASWSAANYQGVEVSVVVLNQLNQPTEVRPLSAPFHQGERFRLRVTSTFDTLVSVDSYRPGSVQRNDFVLGQTAWAGQFYPVQPDRAVGLRAGEAVSLPMGSNEYFVYATDAGIDRLVLNLRSAQAGAGAADTQPVYRQDTDQATFYTQLAEAGHFPSFSQAIPLHHAE